MPLLLWMTLIFLLSAQPQVESAQTSNAAANILYALLSVFFRDIDREAFLVRFAMPVRKFAHFGEFMILGILLYAALDVKDRGRKLLICVLCSVLYAASDEIHQLFVQGRCCSIADMTIDSFGGISGILTCHLINSRWKNTSG